MSSINLGDVQTRVKNQFGDTSGAVITDADIARWATDAQIDIVRRTKCNLTVTPILTISGQGSYDVSDILDINQIEYNGQTLRHATRQELHQHYPTRNQEPIPTAPPEYWTGREGGFDLYPAPDSTGAIARVTHNRRPPPVAVAEDVFEIPEQYHEQIVTKVLQRAYETDGQWPAADRKGAEYKEAVGETAHEAKVKDDDSYPAVRVLPGDYGNA